MNSQTMNDQIQTNVTSGVTSIASDAPKLILPAEARDTSRRSWLSHMALLTGAVAATSLTSRVMAQTPAPGTAANVTPASEGSAPTNVPSPNGSQAVADASIVADTKANPNNPANVIPGAAKSAAQSDVAILNFALGLEYLEAEYYASIVAANQRRQYLTPRQAEVAQKLANDEAAHVSAILEILNTAGATPVAKPAFKFPDKVYISNVAFLDLATDFEETGVGAYLGAAPKVVSKDALRFAASVYGIEARHTGLIRFLSGQFYSVTDTEVPLTVEQVQVRVAPYIVM